MAQIRKRGDRWMARIRKRGAPEQTATFRTKAAAERWARDIESQVERGTFIASAREAERTTLDEALDRYAREVSAGKRSNKPELRRIAQLRKRDLAQRTLASIRGADIATLRDQLADGRSPATVVRYLAILSHLWRVAAREWGMEGLTNPVAAVKKPSEVGRERTRRAQGDELQRILAEAAKRDWWAPAVIELAAETAMRRGELATLTWAGIDLQAGIAHLPKTKNGEARDVPLSPRAVQILDAIPRRLDGLVFGVAADTITRAYSAARDAAGVKGLRLHDLRREATSRLFERGDLSIVEIASITGHKTLQMLKRYSAPRAADIAAKLAGKKNPATKAG